ncbi:membrane protein insertion efficiency factor YidD [Pelagibacterales bacterium SAG-MED15]|nr:membrane protein insertion efficiency factor YidD [Pelagibacterales bacterium SAG-MED15]
MKYILIYIIKIYKYLISPLIGNNCRYLPTCSDYFIDCLNEFGLIKGSYMGTKRLLSCHPIKFLGGGEGYDPIEKKKVK